MKKLGALSTVLVLAAVGVLAGGVAAGVHLLKLRQQNLMRRTAVAAAVNAATGVIVQSFEVHRYAKMYAAAAPSLRAAIPEAAFTAACAGFQKAHGDSPGGGFRGRGLSTVGETWGDGPTVRVGTGTPVCFFLTFERGGEADLNAEFERSDAGWQLARLSLRPAEGPALELPTATAAPAPAEGKP